MVTFSSSHTISVMPDVYNKHAIILRITPRLRTQIPELIHVNGTVVAILFGRWRSLRIWRTDLPYLRVMSREGQGRQKTKHTTIVQETRFQPSDRKFHRPKSFATTVVDRKQSHDVYSRKELTVNLPSVLIGQVPIDSARWRWLKCWLLCNADVHYSKIVDGTRPNVNIAS
jgi:hypothetical protein